MRFRKELVSSATVTLVLATLSRGENYGYEIVRSVNAMSDGVLEWQEGTLYPALHKMEKDGLITSRWVEADNGRKRKYYRLTKKGLRECERQKTEWSTFATAVNKVLQEATT